MEKTGVFLGGWATAGDAEMLDELEMGMTWYIGRRGCHEALLFG